MIVQFLSFFIRRRNQPMKLSTRLFLLAAMMCSFLLLPSVPLVALIEQWFALSPTQQPGSLALQAPALFKSAHAQAAPDFLASEAGISAYVNIEKPVNFVLLKKAFKNIQNISIVEETTDYLSAMVTPPGYADKPGIKQYADVNLYIHKDGWIIAYLPKQVPTVMIIDFANYEQQKLDATILSNTIALITSALNVTLPPVSYYDFAYPEANALQLVTDVEYSLRFDKETNTFSIEIPSSLTVLATSWMHVAYNIDESYFALDETKLSEFASCFRCWRVNYGYLDDSALLPDTNHSFVIYNNLSVATTDYPAKTQAGLAILYKR